MRDYPSFPIVIPLLKEDSYALLTRPPLKFLLLKISVRLACVKHTASVHPEPGSNSQKIQRFKIFENLKHPTKWDPFPNSFFELEFYTNRPKHSRVILSPSRLLYFSIFGSQLRRLMQLMKFAATHGVLDLRRTYATVGPLWAQAHFVGFRQVT